MQAILKNIPAFTSWQKAMAIAMGTILIVLLAYNSTVLSMVAIWLRSETFTHGFLIFPISAWLIWRKRHELMLLTPSPFYPALLILIALGLIWLMGDLAGVVVVQQYSLMAMVPVMVAGLLGRKIAYALAFPLAFLLLAVPFGEILLPPLMEFTADFTILALQLTGIPVYREGLYFTVPSGNWSVVEACSGLRYLIASLTLGSLYAYLTYRSLKRRLIFIVLSVLVPIIANGFRAYMIVMIGHLSDMRLAVGVDHLIYGWVFFGIVMMIMFWIGARWREDVENELQPGKVGGIVPNIPLRPLWIVALSVMLTTMPWSFYSAYLKSHTATRPVALIAPEAPNTWIKSKEPVSTWQPLFSGSAAKLSQTYINNGRPINLQVFYFRDQKQDAEMVSSGNVLVSTADQTWGKISELPQTVTLTKGSLELIETELRSPSQKLLLWHWYWVGGETTSNPYKAKWLQARARLLGKGDEAAVIVLSVPFDENIAATRQLLSDYLNATLPQIEMSLQRAAES